MKTRLSESTAQRKYSEGLGTSIVIGLFFGSRLQGSLDHKRHELERKWKRNSEFFDSDSVKSISMTPVTDTDFKVSLARKRSNDFDFVTDSVPNEASL